MTLFIFTPHTTFILSPKITSPILKRFYPGHAHKLLTVLGRSSVPFRFNQNTLALFQFNTTALVPYTPPSSALVRYDPTQIQRLYYRHNKPEISLTTKQELFSTVEDALVPFINACAFIDQMNNDYTFIKEAISSKSVIPDHKLQSFLGFFKNNCNQQYFTKEDQKKGIEILLEYFQLHPPCVDIFNLFYVLWFEGQYNLLDLRPIKSPKTASDPEENIIDNLSPKRKVTDNTSYEDKKTDALNKALIICEKINTLFLKDNEKELLYSKEINKWYEYLETRGSVIPLQPKEIEIYNKLLIVKAKYFPKKEDLLANEKDNLKSLKEAVSTELPTHLTTKIEVENYLLEDFKKYKDNVIALLDKLENNHLSLNALKLISIISGATIIDEEGSFKITQKGYEQIVTMKKELGIQGLTKLPDAEILLNNIKEKKGIILIPSQQTPDAIVPVAHLSHNALTIILPGEEKDIMIRTGLSTSTINKTTLQIDKYQLTNPDITKQNKEQRFRILDTFIIVNQETESLSVNVEMTLHFRGLNSENKDITDLLVKAFERKKAIWANNPYQFTYTADKEFLRKLTTAHLNKKLIELENNAQLLKDKLDTLYDQDIIKYDIELQKCHVKKEMKKQEREDQLYYSLLPEPLQKLELSLQKVEEIMKKNELVNKNKEQKKEMEKTAVLFKEKQKAEQTDLTTASQKKKDYLKKKEQERENYAKKDT